MHIDGQVDFDGGGLADEPGFRRIDVAELSSLLLPRGEKNFAVIQDADDEGILFHHRRQLDDGAFLFLVNTSIEDECRGEIRSAARGVQEWDPLTGEMHPYPFERRDSVCRARFSLPPCGSLLLFLSHQPLDPQTVVTKSRRTLQPVGSMRIQRLEPNVLTLDYVDATVGDESVANRYFYSAQQFVFQKHGFEKNPWDSAVQFRDELISKTFPPDSGFSATYHFTIRDAVPASLEIVIERPDLYSITCNDKRVTPSEGHWWLDRAFGRLDLRAAARFGRNAVTLTAKPMTMYHELEPAYLLGDFALEPTEAGFEIVADRSLELRREWGHGNAIEGTMWLSSGVGYRRDAAADEGNDRDPYLVLDLGQAHALSGIQIWNYNEENLPERGVNEVVISGSTSGTADSFTIPIGEFELDPASGAAGAAGQRLATQSPPLRYVKFDICSNHRGVTYPVTAATPDSAFVGLSEVRFYSEATGGAGDQQIESVVVHEVSSELTGGHDRRAAYLVDGSGLSEVPVGWDRQGHPFYAAGVAYTQQFHIPQPQGDYRVSLGDWRGSVARVSVNGQPAGYITHAPWECDISRKIHDGRNTIEVVVIGTLKNTLGPHHAGALRGAAWPHMFQRGPETGPPPGTAYDTIGYGLFEPFSVVQTQ
jgi:hypothetical protein